MSDINNLAENLGLATNNRYVNQMPFTKAANTELNLAIQQKREEQKRLEAERKMQQEITNRLKFKGDNLDKIGRDLYADKFSKTVMSGYTPEAGVDLELFYREQEDEGKAYKELKKNVDKYLLPADIKAAWKNDDLKYLKQKAQENPNLGLIPTPSGRVLLDANRMVEDIDVDKYFSDLNKDLAKDERYWQPLKGGKTTNQFGRVFQQAAISPTVLQEQANNIFTTNPNQSPEASAFEHNYLVKRQADIEKELSKPIYKSIPQEEALIQAAKQVFINEGTSKLRNNVEVKVEKGRSGEVSEYFRNGDTYTTGKSNKWTYTYDPTTKEMNVNTGSVGGVPLQNLTFREFNEDRTKVKRVPTTKEVKIISVKPLKNGEWMITAKKNTGGTIYGMANEQALQSYMDKFPANGIIKEFYNSKGKPTKTESNKPKSVGVVKGKKDDKL